MEAGVRAASALSLHVRHDQPLRLSELFLVVIESKKVRRFHHQSIGYVKDVKPAMASLQSALLREALRFMENIRKIGDLPHKTATSSIDLKLIFEFCSITFSDGFPKFRKS